MQLVAAGRNALILQYHWLPVKDGDKYFHAFQVSEWWAQWYFFELSPPLEEWDWEKSRNLPSLTPRGGVVKHHWGYWMTDLGRKWIRRRRSAGVVGVQVRRGNIHEVLNNKLIKTRSGKAMDEGPDRQGSGRKKKPITEQWAVSPIHYVGTDKLPAVRAGAALNKSKLTTPPWPYLKYSFPTSPSPASIKLHLLQIQVPPPPIFQGFFFFFFFLLQGLDLYSLGCFQKYVLPQLTGLTGGCDSQTVHAWAVKIVRCRDLKGEGKSGATNF